MTDVLEIEEKVIKSIISIANAMGEDDASVTKETRFFEDLGFGLALRRELAKPMTKISVSFRGGRISKKEAGKCTKVSDACKLIVNKIRSNSKRRKVTKFKKAITLLFLIGSYNAYGQGNIDYSLSKHSSNKNLVSDPATIQYTSPKKGDSSIAIDVALKATILPRNSNWEYSLALERHKNTLIDEEQNTDAVVLSMEGSWGDVERGYSIIPELSVSYNKDKVAGNDNLLVIGELSFIKGCIGVNKLIGRDNLKLYWAPTIALEYNDILDSKNKIEGSVGRSYIDFDIGIYPLFTKLDKGRFQLSMSYSYWKDIFESSKIDDDDDCHSLLNYGMTLELTERPPKGTKKIAVTLGIVWFDGIDVRKNKKGQTYSQVSLGFKY